MALTLVATAGAADANSYLTEEEADSIFEARLHTSLWDDADDEDKPKALAMATKVLDRMLMPGEEYVQNGDSPYYRVRPTWTGMVATTTQALAWPRAGMYDANGNAIAEDVIPGDLKEATAELALQLLAGDRTLDNDVAVQGLTGLRVGSISLSFKDLIEAKVIPDAVWNALVPSWVTSEVFRPARTVTLVSLSGYVDGCYRA